MSCSRCSSSSSSCTTCSCSGSTVPYYAATGVRVENNCEKIYENQFSFALCASTSWNIPACGFTAILKVPGVQNVAIGSYLWNPNYGYFEISSIDVDNETVGITNNCNEENAAAGTQIPACTCFVVTAEPVSTGGASELFPYVAIDFTAPANTDCIDITVTTINGLNAGETISIGSGFYTISSLVSATVITICNDGDGILAGTPVIAQDAANNYVYPIAVVSSCCNALTPRVTDLETDLAALTASTATLSGTVATNTANIAVNTAAIATVNSTLASTYVAVLDRVTTAVTVSNTIVDTAIYSKSIAANTLAAGRMLRLTMVGQLGNVTGGVQFGTIRLYLGGVLIGITTGGIDITPPSNRDVLLTYNIIATGAATQRGTLLVDSAYDVASPSPTVIYTASTANSLIANTLQLNIQLSTASASLSFIMHAAVLEYV